MYHTNLRLRLHLHKVVVPIGTARLAPPSLADELLRTEEDEDTSGTADTDPKQRQAVLLVCNARFLIVKKVVSGKKSVMSTNHCAEHLVGEFALVHLTFGSCTSPTNSVHFTYHPFNAPAYAR